MEDRALYLEADEDITSAIDKLKKAPDGPVQIVVPKRSTLLQSVINLKLLKKAADDSKRELVLVTGDKVATDLAARLGLAVAPSVGAKATVAEAAKDVAAPAAEEVIEDDTPAPPPQAASEPEPPMSQQTPPPPAKEDKPTKKPRREVPPPLLRQRQVADTPADEPLAEAADVGGGKSKAKVPNYNRFQKRLIWIGAAVLLIIAYFIGTYFFSSAKVTLFVSASPTTVSSDFGVDPSISSSNIAALTLAGQTISASKTITSTFQATGSQDEGTKASGNLSVSNCSSSNAVDVPAGTTFTSNGLNFVSTADATISQANFNHGACVAPGSGTVSVTASANGGQYNLTNATFTSSTLGSGYTINASQLSGGTSNIVKVVAQGDVTGAQTAALANDKAAEQKALASKVPSGFMMITDSFTQMPGTPTSSPAVGQQATSATLTLPVTYTELAVPKADVDAFLKAQAQSQLGANSQVYDDGFSGAQISAAGKTSAGLAQFKITTTAYGGAKIDTSTLAKQLKGQRYGDAVETASSQPDVTSATISLFPPWLSSLPHIQSHITIKITVAKAQ